MITARPRALQLLLVAALLGLGCRGAGPALPPMRAISQSAAPIALNGTTVEPPSGSNWFLVETNTAASGVLFLIKKVDGEEVREDVTHRMHTIAAQVVTYRLSTRPTTASELGRELRENPPAAGRHQLRDVQVKEDPTLGPGCVRADWVADDFGVPGHEGERYILESHGFHCVHPHSPEYIVEVSYSQRRKAEDAAVPIKDEGERFIRSAKFVPLGNRN